MEGTNCAHRPLPLANHLYNTTLRESERPSMANTRGTSNAQGFTGFIRKSSTFPSNFQVRPRLHEGFSTAFQNRLAQPSTLVYCFTGSTYIPFAIASSTQHPSRYLTSPSVDLVSPSLRATIASNPMLLGGTKSSLRG